MICAVVGVTGCSGGGGGARPRGTHVTDGGHRLVVGPGVLGINLVPRGVAGNALITLDAGTYHLRSVPPAG